MRMARRLGVSGRRCVVFAAGALNALFGSLAIRHQTGYGAAGGITDGKIYVLVGSSASGNRASLHTTQSFDFTPYTKLGFTVYSAEGSPRVGLVASTGWNSITDGVTVPDVAEGVLTDVTVDISGYTGTDHYIAVDTTNKGANVRGALYITKIWLK